MPQDLLDQDSPDTIRVTEAEARFIGERALKAVGYTDEEAGIVVDQLVDNALCGYRFASLPRILTIAADQRTYLKREPIRIVRETASSALVDGGNQVGYITAFRGAEIAAAKAKQSGIAMVGVYNSFYSGRNAFFVEHIVKSGLVAIHSSSAKPHVLPPGGAAPALGTNPFCVGFPSAKGPVIYDIGTASVMWGEVLLMARLGHPMPEGTGFDKDGNPTTDAAKVAEGGVSAFGGHKGFGLSFAIQALGLMAGAALTSGNVTDYGFFFIAMDPEVMLPGNQFEQQMAELVDRVKATPRQKGVEEIRIPSERAFRERDRRRVEGIVLDRAVVDALNAL